LIVAFRSKRRQKLILIKEKGEILRIPVDEVKDFIDQMLGQNPYLSDFDTTLRNKGKRIYINISSVFNDAVSIRQEVNQIRKILKGELGRVFEFARFKINFQIKGIGINPEKKYFSSRFMNEERIDKEEVSAGQVLTPTAKTDSRGESPIEEEDLEDKKVHKNIPWIK